MLTFPTYHGELPECLNPLNLRHYWLLAYWVFFRPTALKCYLYRADPEFYRAGLGLSIFRTLFVPVYRNLFLTAIGTTILFWVLITLLVIGVALPFKLALYLANYQELDLAFNLISSFAGYQVFVLAFLTLSLVFSIVGGVVRGVLFGVVRGVLFGVTSGVTFAITLVVCLTILVFYLANLADFPHDDLISKVLPGAVSGLGFGIAFNTVGGIAGCMAIDVVFVMLIIGVGIISILGFPGNLAFGVAFGVGALRVVFYLFEFGLALRSTSGKGKHPVEWDELIVLPLPGTQRVLAEQLQQEELSGLRLVADVARNPFQRWVAQRTLKTYLHNQTRPLHFLYTLFDSPNLSTYISAPVSKKDWQKLTSTGHFLLGELGGQCVNTKTGWAEQLVERLVWSLTWFCRDQRQTPLALFASMLYQLLDNKTVNRKSFRLSNYQKAYTGLNQYPGSKEIVRLFETLSAFLAYDNILTLPEAAEVVSGLTPDEKSIRPTVLTALLHLGAVGAEVAAYQATNSHIKQKSALAHAIKSLNQLNEYVVAEVATPEQNLLQRIICQWQTLINEAVGSIALEYTFPTYRGKLPQCLSPLNLRHYFLLAYWVYFRPTALNCYLYQADPDLYRTKGFSKIIRTLRIPAYRNLYWMALGAISLFSVLVVLLVVPDELVIHSQQVNAVAVIPGEYIAISASSDGTVKMWDLDRKPPLSILPNNISALFNNTSKQPDNRRWRERLTWKSGVQGITAVAVTPDKRYVITGLTDTTSFSYDYISDYIGLGWLIPYLENTFKVRIYNRNLNSTNKIQIVGTGTLKVWKWENGEEEFTLKGHQGQVNAIAITPDGQYAVSASADKALKVWELKSGKELRTLTGHAESVNAVAITPDGQYAVSASTDKTLKVWELKSGKELRTLTGHAEAVNAVAITPDGKAISTSDDRTLRVWNLSSGKELRILTGHASRVRVIALTSDGKRGISFSVTGRIPLFWDLKKGIKLSRANDLLDRLRLASLEYGLTVMMVISGVLSVPLILAVSVVTFGVVGTLIGGVINVYVLSYAYSPVQNIVFDSLVGVIPEQVFTVILLLINISLMVFGIAGSVASRKAFGVVGSVVVFAGLGAIVCGVYANVVPETSLNVVGRVAVSLMGSLIFGVVGGAWYGIMVIPSASRLIFHPVFFVLALRSRFGKGKHPVEWDELVVLPLPGTQRILTQRLHHNEVNGLRLVAEVAANPFQRAFAQQVLYTYLHRQVAPLRFLYELLTNPNWQAYIYAPLNKQDWERLPTTGQLLLGELGGQWVDCSSGRFNQWAERRVWKLTRSLRNQCQTKLTRFANILYQLLDEKTVEAEDFDLSSYRNAYVDLTLYTDGEEITRSFEALATFLAYNQLSDLARAVDILSGLVPTDTAVRPSVLTALAGLGAVGAEVATYQAATNRVNQLAALARATKSLDELDEYIFAEVVTPEKALLRRIVRQWHLLVTDASGRVRRAEAPE